jgi:hypothetical protein
MGGEPGVPNHAIVPVAPDGTVCITTGVHAADVIVDVDGWFSFAAGLSPESPRRVLDTRTTGGPTTDVAVAAAPPGARAAVVNLTAAGGSNAAGYVTAFSCGTPLPLASNLNFEAGQTVANAAVVRWRPTGHSASTPRGHRPRRRRGRRRDRQLRRHAADRLLNRAKTSGPRPA